MFSVNTKRIPKSLILTLSLMTLIGFLSSTNVQSQTLPTSPNGIQLAANGYVGYPGWQGYGYYSPAPVVYVRRPTNFYWTRWKYLGHRCKRSCLINRWNGVVVRCKKVCI